jgi:hypothetical protein
VDIPDGAGRHGAGPGSGRRGLRLGGAARRHTAQRGRRAHRGSARRRVHRRTTAAKPQVHLWLRPGRGPGRRADRGDHRRLVSAYRLGSGTAARPSAPGDQPGRGRRRRAGRVRRERTRRVVPHPGRAQDRLSGPGRRRDACPRGRAGLAGGAARRGWRRAGLGLGRPGGWPDHHRGDPGRAAAGHAGHLPQADGRGRSRADPPGRGHAPGHIRRPRCRPGPAAVDRPPVARRVRDRRRPHGHRCGRARGRCSR